MVGKALIFGWSMLTLGVGSVWACSCLPAPSVQDEFARSHVVARVRVERTEGARSDAELMLQGTATHRAVMWVERAFKGDLAAGRLIDVAQGHGTFCGFFFSEEYKGQEFLLYLDAAEAKTNVFPGPVCGRSQRASEATVDINYLERRAKLEGKTMLAGEIHGLAPKNRRRGVSVTARGGGRTHTTKTSEDGYFEFVDLRPGRYMVSVDGVIDYFYFAPSAKAVHGDHARPIGGAAFVIVKAGKMSELGIYLKRD